MCKVSIIIPNYNHAAFLTQRIESVINQTFQDIELIILDDYSTDKSREIIELYRTHPKVKAIIFNESNSGSPFNQWKKGVALASGDYIWIAESDDLAETDFLEKALNFKADFTFARIVDIDDNGKKMDSARGWFDIFPDLNWDESYFKEGNQFFKYLKERCIIPNISSLVFKKSYFDQYSYVFKDMKYCGDWLFYLTCAKNGASFQYVADSTSYFRQHQQTTRWQNKDVFKPIEERFKCFNYVNQYTNKNPVFNNDLSYAISRILSKKILIYLFRNPKIGIKYSNLFFKALKIKYQNIIKKTK